jgi:hypothetical protein
MRRCDASTGVLISISALLILIRASQQPVKAYKGLLPTAVSLCPRQISKIPGGANTTSIRVVLFHFGFLNINVVDKIVNSLNLERQWLSDVAMLDLDDRDLPLWKKRTMTSLKKRCTITKLHRPARVEALQI